MTLKYFIVIDVETLGLPFDWNAPAEDVENWPEIIEIAWQLYDERRELLNADSLLVKPKKRKIPLEIENLTGITTALANSEGVELVLALKRFISILQRYTPTLVAHNYDFDFKVIEASLIKSNLGFSLNSFESICTMKSSVAYCDLPNQKYPKLDELYKILFDTQPDHTHRALSDVKSTVKSFFKLIDLGVIRIVKTKKTILLDKIDVVNTDIVKTSIKNYLSDLNNFPIYYDLNKIEHIYSNTFIEEVISKYNDDFQVWSNVIFKIPYNLISSRLVISLPLEDIIIRYILMDKLNKFTHFSSSLDKYDSKTLSLMIQQEIENGNPLVINIDIENCYESVSHSKLINSIAIELGISTTSIFLKKLEHCLRVEYKDENNEFKFYPGVLVGSKPDEYFAEYYLSKIEEAIKDAEISIIRIADEFIFFADSFFAARNKYESISKIISNYGMKINRTKSSLKDHRSNVLDKKLDIKLIETSIREPSIPFVFKTAHFELQEVVNETTITFNEEVNLNELNSMPQIESGSIPGLSEINYFVPEPNFEIDSYESAIVFLKYLINSQTTLSQFQGKYPQFKYLYNIVFSQPTDFLNDYENCNKAILNFENIQKLKKVIFYYPKSEYYTALALKLLVYAATKLIYCTSTEIPLEGLSLQTTRVCEAANLIIIEVLKSTDIHPYQKYILLREIYKNKNDFQLKLSNYHIEMMNYFDSHYIDFQGNFVFEGKLPFQSQVYQMVSHLKESDYLPLKNICGKLLELK